MAFFLHPHALPLPPSYPYIRTSATGLYMKRIRFQDDEPSVGGIAAGVALGALAGFAVGIIVAQRAGGFAGLTAKLRERFGALTERDELEEGEERHVGDAFEEDDEAYDDEELDDDSALEEQVLAAFRDDAVLSERAIDIGAIGEGIIELSGWVESEEESDLATQVTRSVDGIVTVVNRLSVGTEDDGDPDLDEDEVDADTSAPMPGGVWEGQRVGTGRRRQGNSSEVGRHADPKPVLEDRWLDEQHAIEEAAGEIEGSAERRRGKKAKGPAKPTTPDTDGTSADSGV